MEPDTSDEILRGESFILLPDGRKGASNFAFQTFPELDKKFDGPDDEFREDVYHVYDLLGAEMVMQWNDETFRKRSCQFMNDLAASGDSLLEELLIICVLESLAADATVSEQARKCLGEKACGFLIEVERKIFGR